MEPVSILLASIFLAWLFVTAGWHKVREPQHYIRVINAYDLPLLEGSQSLVWSIAGLELVIAVALLMVWTRPYAALLAAVLLVVYGVVIGVNILRGKRDIDCGCSGPLGRQPLSGWLLWRNASLVLIALYASSQMAVQSIGWFDWVVILFGSLLAILLYQICERLSFNSHLLVRLRG